MWRLTVLSEILSIYQSIYISISLSVCMSVYLSIYLSIHLSIYLSVYLSVCLSIFLSIYPSIYLSICISICLSVCLSIYLWLYSCLLDLGRFFTFFIPYTAGWTPWTGDQPIARPLPTHRTTQTHNKRTQTSMPRVRWDSNPRSQCSSGRRRFMPQTALPLRRAWLHR
jgi:hypothetical protein